MPLPSSPPRFDMQATTLEGVEAYFLERAIQGLHEGWEWSGVTTPLTSGGVVWGARTTMRSAQGEDYQSIYVLDDHTGQGHFTRTIARFAEPVLTAPSCHIEDYLSGRGIPYRVAGRFTETTEYRAIAACFDRRYAQRSGVHYMHHIDEGLAVLTHIGATEEAMRAFCLHPLLQADEELQQHHPRAASMTEDPYVMMLAMEYRHVANAHLSHHTVSHIGEIALGPLPEVHDMLRADKIQNYKDFLIFHATTHPRRDALRAYFERWLERLEIDAESFEALRAWLDVGARARRGPAVAVE